MQRSDFDFDVISGPSTPPLRPPAQPSPATPAPAGDGAAPAPARDHG